MLLKKIEDDLILAQKEKDSGKISFLRFLLARLHDLAIEKGKDKELTDEDIIQELSKEAKRHQESIDAFQKGGRCDLVEKEEQELTILQGYLPAQLSDSELEHIIEEEMVKVGGDFGSVMKAVMVRVKGQADGTKVVQFVKSKLNEG
jgi:uncharacterized protein YqeY